MPLDSAFVFPPAFRVVTDAIAAVNGGTIEFYSAGTSTPKTVYSNADLSTGSLGSIVYLDSAGHPVASQGSSTKVVIYTGSALIKMVVKDSNSVTLATYDHVKCTLDTSALTGGEGSGITGVSSKTADFSIVLADDGKLFACDPTGGQFTATFPSASTVGDGFTFGLQHAGTSTTNRVLYKTVSSQTISEDGTSTTANALTGGGEVSWFVSDGANWRRYGHTPPLLNGDIPAIKVADRLTAPPSSPTAGAAYIINGTPTGAWSAYAQHDVVRADGQGNWHRFTPAADSGWIAYVQDENRYTAFIGSAWVDLSGMEAPQSSTLQELVAADIKTSGTAGGTATATTWTKRNLNTSVRNSITSASHDTTNSQITLPAGSYLIALSSSFVGVTSTSLRLKSTTTSTEVRAANAYFLSSAGGTHVGFGTLVLAGTETFELQYYVASTAGGSTGALGTANTIASTTEIYSQVYVLSLSSLQGPAGAQGAQGNPGADGGGIGKWNWETSTSSGPASGAIRFNNATFASVTSIYLHETDLNAVGLAATIATWDDSTSTIKGTIKVYEDGSPANFWIGDLTALTDNGSDVTLTVTHRSSGGSFSAGDDLIVVFIPKGDKGDTGTTGAAGSAGATGATGATGPNTGLDYAFNTATSGDPGSGKLLVDSATISSVTQVNISETGRNAEALAALIATWDDSTNTAHYGHLRIFTVSDRTKFIELEITGTITDAGSYRTIPVSYTAGGTLPANNDVVAVMFERTGNKGADGAGTGDFSSNTATSVDSEIVLFSGTAGKTGKRATTTGILKGTSGVLSAAVSGTDYAPATSGSAILKGNGSGGFSNAAAGTDYVAPGGVLGTPSSGTLTNCTGLPVAGITASTSTALGVGSVELGHATDTTISRSAAGRAAVEGKDILLKGQTDTLTAGYSATPFNAGTKSSGTFTPVESDGAFQYAVNGGAHTLAPPTNNTSIVIQYTNNGSAGTITTSGFTKKTGDTLSTTNGDDFMCYVTKNNGFSHLHVVALQ